MPPVLAVAAAAAARVAGALWPSGDGPPRAAATHVRHAPSPRPAGAHRRAKSGQSKARAFLPLLRRGPTVGAAHLAVRARGAILVDAGTGTVLWAKAPHR